MNFKKKLALICAVVMTATVGFSGNTELFSSYTADNSVMAVISSDDALLQENGYFVVVGTYGGDASSYTQLRYTYQSSGNYHSDKVVWKEAPDDLVYGDVLIADGEVTKTRVQDFPDSPAYMMSSYQLLSSDTVLTKVGTCSELDLKNLTITEQLYDGSGHWTIKLEDENGGEYSYGFNPLLSSLGINLAYDAEIGDVYTFAFYDGAVVVPLEKYENNSSENNENKGDESGSGYTYDVSVREEYGHYIIGDDGYEAIYQLDGFSLTGDYISEYLDTQVGHNIVLPGVVDDITVNSLSFCDCIGIKNLAVPDTFLIIDGYMAEAEELESLTIPESVRQINLDGEFNEDFFIRGYYGTYAEKYAEKSGYDFCAVGDLNNDTENNVVDLVKMLGHMYGVTELNERELMSADCNLDFSVNIADLVMMKNNLLDPKMTNKGASMEGAVVKPEFENEATPAISSQAYNGFVSDITSDIMLYDTEQNPNPVYSPMSVYMALSMAAECADGTTQQELLDLLNVDDTDDLADINQRFFNSTNFDTFDEYCKLSNSVWLNNMYIFETPVLKKLAEKYYAVSFAKDFKNDNVSEEISSWIYKNTSGKIKPDIPVNGDDVAVLLNTITYKNIWLDDFSDPTPDTFYTAEGKAVEHDFLHYNSGFPVDIGFGETYMTYAREMEHGYSMNFVLPDEGVSVEEIFEPETLSAIINDEAEHAERKLIFSSPVFDVKSEYKLEGIVQSLGVSEAFKNTGNFENLINNEKNNLPGVKISDIIHEATIAMDEEGCEAAAFTAIVMAPGCAPPPECETVEFNLNRPFMYFISDSAGTPIFMGVINNPAK